MKITFKINTTVGKPFNIEVEDDITTNQLMGKLLQGVEDNTVLYRSEILDIFAQDTLSGDTLSLPKNFHLVKSLIEINRKYFPTMPTEKNTYNIFVIDVMYREQIDTIEEPSSRNKKEIKTSHFDGFIQTIKHMMKW